MRKLFYVTGLFVLCGSVGAAQDRMIFRPVQKSPLFRLEKVETVEDQKKCASSGGLGALVFPLTETGDMAGEPQLECLTPQK